MSEADRHCLSLAEHDRIFHEAIVPELTRGLLGSDRPRATILGGQPGSGKSALQSEVERELSHGSGVLCIVGDDLRLYHPAYTRLLQQDDKTAAFYTDRDSGRWIEKLITYARQARYNILVESTMRVAAKVSATARDLRAAGYDIEIRALAVHERWSKLGIHQRYERMIEVRGQGRFTVPNAHAAAYVGMLSTLDVLERDNLVDRIAIYTRGNRVLYDNQLVAGEWLRQSEARQVVERERARAWTPAEKITYAQGWERVVAQQTRRSAEPREFEQARARYAAALLALHMNPAAKRLLSEQLDPARFHESERRAAAHAFARLTRPIAMRHFPALEACYLVAERAAQRYPAPRTGRDWALYSQKVSQWLSAHIEHAYPAVPDPLLAPKINLGLER